eukprot:TRINITY_DN6804_c0_g1_i10.p1 TRINITY_DN6804_c0_g1~~TRINITY_DN6804_c0_g1_i10.p1  ORF type:complete len:151 (-),score=43.84 TRINITY_DN6804_c0_g1_i10:145-597(-)
MKRRFESCWKKTNQKLHEVISLTNWCIKFKESYHKTTKELQRREKFEAETDAAVEAFRKQLSTRFEKELKQRNEFNADVIKYLPSMFHELLERSPVKYEVYPVKKPLRKAVPEEAEEDLFADLHFENLLPKSSGSEIKKESVFKPRTTSV